jgi:hypothetical protein
MPSRHAHRNSLPVARHARLRLLLLPRACRAARALNQVIQALAANRITARRAGILLQGIQMASGHSFSGPIDFDSPLDSVHTQNSPPHLQDLKK